MNTLISYKNDPILKANFVKEVDKHRKLDAIEQGTYGHQNGTWKGCAVACSLRSLAILEGEKLTTEYRNHKDYETKLGIPEWLARLEDTIFEGLPKEEAMKWPTAFAKAVPVGKNLEPVKWHFSAYLMKENIERVLTLDISDNLKEQVIGALRGVLLVHTNAIETGIWDESAALAAENAAWSAAANAAWNAAENAAWSAANAAWNAARSTARSTAWSAARNAARSTANAAWSAARSAAWSAAWSAANAAWNAARSTANAARSAKSAAYVKHSKELLKLLKKA